MSIESVPSLAPPAPSIASVETGAPRVSRLLAANVAMQLAGMLAGQLLAFDAAVHLAPAGGRWGAWMVGLVGGAFNVTRLAAVPWAGRTCDTRGADRVLLASPFLGSIAAAVAAGTANAGIRGVAGATVLVAARLVEGASAACAIPAMLTLLSRATEGRPAARTRIMGMFELTALAGLLGAMLAAALLWDAFGTRSLLVLAPLYALAIPLLTSRSGTRAPAPGDANQPPPLLAALRTILTQRAHVLFAAVWIATNALVGLWLQYMPYVLMLGARSSTQRLVGALSGRGTTTVLAAVGVLYVGGTALWSTLGARVGRRIMLSTALAATVVMSVVLTAVNHGAPPALHAVTAVCILLQGGITPAALALLADLTGDDDRVRGTAMGVFSSLLGIGQFAGVLLGAPLVSRWQLDGILGASAVLAVFSIALLTMMATRPTAQNVPAVRSRSQPA